MIEEVIIFGAIQGAVYALIAIGFSLVYGVGGILNLAHGAFYLIAAYAALWFIPYLGVPLNLAMAATVIVRGISFVLSTMVGAGVFSYLGVKMAAKPEVQR